MTLPDDKGRLWKRGVGSQLGLGLRLLPSMVYAMGNWVGWGTFLLS